MLTRHRLPLDGWDSFVLVEDGAAHLKSTAFLRIVARLSGPWPVLAVARFLPEGLRDRLYDLIARNRYRLFGRHNSCMVPTQEVRARFLEFER